MKRLVIIGPGNIAKFHIQALKYFNFEIVGCISRDGSNSSHEFMSNYGKNKSEYFSDFNYMLHNTNQWDAVLISCPTINQFEYIDKLSKFQKPILVEKPVSLSIDKLVKYKNNSNIMVAFNRRYYESVKEFKTFVNLSKNIFINVNIPESSKSINEKSPSNFLPISIYENSIHIFDLINYLFDNVSWSNIISSNNSKLEFLSAHGLCKSGSPIVVNLMLDSPENFSISANVGNKKAQLKPIEMYRLYEGFQIDEPSHQVPIRRYSPKVIDESYSESIMNCKPGFYNQAKTFSELCDGKQDITFPNINDAAKAIESINSISKLIKEI